jgi:hypothetical protein
VLSAGWNSKRLRRSSRPFRIQTGLHQDEQPPDSLRFSVRFESIPYWSPSVYRSVWHDRKCFGRVTRYSDIGPEFLRTRCCWPYVAIWDMIGREAMMLQTSSKAVSGEFRAGGTATRRRCG